MKVISLGWGVQSFGLAAMSALGVLPKVDAAVHADTTHERSETYDFARRWTPWLEERGVKVITVKPPREIAGVFWSDNDYCHAAFHTVNIETGQHGVMLRACTDRWKIRPIRQWIRKEMKQRGLSKTSGIIETWLGITLDEVQRMKPSNVQYISNEYPFIEYLDRPWTRGMVMRWLSDNGLEIPVKSSCIFCPYHDKGTWREIKMSGNGDWQKALEVDEAIRDKWPGYKCYLIAQRIPLAEADFRSEEDHGQLSLWGEECSGMCFL